MLGAELVPHLLIVPQFAVGAFHMVVGTYPCPFGTFQERYHLVELLPLQQTHRLHQFRNFLLTGLLQQQGPPPPRQPNHLLRAEQHVDVATKVPQGAQFGQIREHLAQVVPIPPRQVLGPLDDQEAVLVHERRLLLVPWPTLPCPPLLLLTLASAASLA